MKNHPLMIKSFVEDYLSCLSQRNCSHNAGHKQINIIFVVIYISMEISKSNMHLEEQLVAALRLIYLHFNEDFTIFAKTLRQWKN